MKNNKVLTYAFIITFGILYLCTAFVSFYHAIEFFNLANEKWLSIILSLVAEIGQAAVLFSLLASKDKNKILPWIIMGILTLLQIIGNVFSCYAYIEKANAPEFLYFQKSILFFLDEAPEVMKVIVAWIVGSILPVIALSMTSLVETNIQDLSTSDVDDINDKVVNDAEQPIVTEERIKTDNKNVVIVNNEPDVRVDTFDMNNDSINDELNDVEYTESVNKILSEFDKTCDSVINDDLIEYDTEQKTNEDTEKYNDDIAVTNVEVVPIKG